MGNEDMSNEEAAIRRNIEKLIEGLQAKDPDALRPLYAPDIVSFDVQPPLQHVGVEAKLKNWEPVFTGFETVRYEIRDLTLSVGDDLAFGHAFGRLGGTLKGGTAIDGMWVRVTYCLRKTGGEWLITHDQVSVPFDIATGKGVVDLEP
ncbi:YybH family protein [Streptomyces sp. TLI_55]|uniref:YybH family protein n=1 Tax=Streptomyces sp. TLI_55 TaxID=1938861 RepID=UPI001C5350AE|nr:nuclear transport factor 2 family protein [Streptomyces sp. TLI_55]